MFSEVTLTFATLARLLSADSRQLAVFGSLILANGEASASISLLPLRILAHILVNTTKGCWSTHLRVDFILLLLLLDRNCSLSKASQQPASLPPITTLFYFKTLQTTENDIIVSSFLSKQLEHWRINMGLPFISKPPAAPAEAKPEVKPEAKPEANSKVETRTFEPHPNLPDGQSPARFWVLSVG